MVSILYETAIEAGHYQLRKGAKDLQSLHGFDEIYYILDGEASLTAGDTTGKVKPGSITYIRAKVAHHFLDIAKDLSVLVIFSKAKPSEKDPDYTFYQQGEIEKKALGDSITWSVFHRCSTMAIGIYNLPKVTGGGSTQLHKADEKNIVLKCTAKFSVNGVETNVGKGDVVFVPKGDGHYFHNLNEDFEVMILFEKKSI